MQITNYTNSLFSGEINRTASVASAKVAVKEQNASETVASRSFDTFEYSASNADVGTTYSPDSLASAKVNRISNTTAASGGSRYYNVLINRAANAAGAYVYSNGSPQINSASQAKTYQNHLNKLKGTFWCQTGGWSELSGDGSKECARTAIATMASINSGTIVTPNDTESEAAGITVNGKDYDRVTKTYNMSTGAVKGFGNYDFDSEEDLIDAINNELKNNRSVVVHTNAAGGHWVTITGTKNGKPATSFDDFIGVDPWYNGSNPNNPGTGTGNGATNVSKSGEVQLSKVNGNQQLHSDYRMMTFNIDN